MRSVVEIVVTKQVVYREFCLYSGQYWPNEILGKDFLAAKEMLVKGG